MKRIALFLICICSLTYSQENAIFQRLQALDNNGKVWYNIDGYSVTSEDFNYNFDEKGVKKALRKHSIKDDSRVRDEHINRNNFYFHKTDKLTDDLHQKSSFYLIENRNKKITVIWFIKAGEIDREMERELTNLIIENKIPKENFANMQIGTINFGGRQIDLGNNICHWTALNTVQCPYYGEMNWSVHKDLKSAETAIENQLTLTKSRKGGKVVSEKEVDIEFEGVLTKAKKVTYDFTGITGALAGMSGGNGLTIYYVAEEVRGNYMNCVLSFWNNDQIDHETGLPPLLEKVMELK